MNRMRKLLTIIMVFGLLVSIVGLAAPASAENAQGKNLPAERLLVKFKPGTPWNETAQAHQRVGGKVESIIPGIGVHVVTVPHGQGSSKSAAYRLNKGVQYVEPDGIVQALDTPNDQYFKYQWGMTEVQAPEAWDITQGSSDIVIAILDTGVDMDNPDLAAKIISDANFTDSPTSDYNGHSHGTHVAGIAAAISDNGIGVAGLGYNCSIMNVKVLGDDGFGYDSWVAQGIIWAADNGADVINLSLGSTDDTSALEDAVDYAWSKGVVVVAAAGNMGDSAPFYPAYYSNCIAVGATDSQNNLASFSTRGAWVDVAAPGSSIISSLPDGIYGYKSGTSMASPHVAGLGGLVFSIATDSNGNGRVNDEVRFMIESSCDDFGLDVFYGRINAYQAVQGFSPPPTGQIAGTVTDADTGNAIVGTSVYDGTRSATTDSSGYYSITDVPEGSYIVTASADGYLSSSSSAAVTGEETTAIDFALSHINRAPTMDPVGNQAVAEGQLLQFIVSASDPDGDTLNYSASDLPVGASFDPATQTFIWTPGYDQAGSYDGVCFDVFDGLLSDSEEITITVNDVLLTGQIAGTVTDAASGDAIGDATVSDGTRSTTTDTGGYYSIADVPEGNYTVIASADGYLSTSDSVAVTAGETTVSDVGLTHINHPPTLDPIGDRVVAEGQLLQFVVSASDADGDSLVFTAGDIPIGASFNPATQTFVWTPGYDQAGNYASIGFEVSDGVLSDAEEITITVNDVVLTGQIAGTVTDAASGEAIGGAVVSDGTRSATTDSGGYYSITDVPEGSYTVTALADGYASASSNIEINPVIASTSTMDFSLEKEISPLNTMWVESITFTSSGKHLMVTVKVANPDPVKKAQVNLELVKDGTLVSTFSGLTNKTGEVTFRLRHAANGEYLARIIQLTHEQYVWDDVMGASSTYSYVAW